MIVQAIGLLDDLDKELNTYAMRVREWYGWHFPEMTKIVGDNIKYAQTVSGARGEGGSWQQAAVKELCSCLEGRRWKPSQLLSGTLLLSLACTVVCKAGPVVVMCCLRAAWRVYSLMMCASFLTDLSLLHPAAAMCFCPCRSS
jgi:hypothetical protein